VSSRIHCLERYLTFVAKPLNAFTPYLKSSLPTKNKVGKVCFFGENSYFNDSLSAIKYEITWLICSCDIAKIALTASLCLIVAEVVSVAKA
jgi:hypothetical protein